MKLSQLRHSTTVLIALVVTVAALSKGAVSQQDQCTSNGECAPWMNCTNSTCVCSQKILFHGLLKCEPQGISVLSCNCMTFDNDTGDYVVGACIENCLDTINYETPHNANPEYHPTFKSPDNLTDIMCKRHNRAGRLCGKCMPGYSPQAYTYNLSCVNCTEGNTNLWMYFLATAIPLTCFYFLVVFFKINTTTSHLHGYVIFAHFVTHPAFGRSAYLALQRIPTITVPTNVLFALYGVWNLNFFRTFDTESICLDMYPLSVRALDYTIAVYPFFLTVISYTLIELHDRNYRVLVWIWKPFRCIFTLFRRNWDIRTSIIDAYATFFHITFFKVLCITQDLLIPTYVYTIGKAADAKKPVLYFDGTVDYFGPEHLPYAIPATVIAVLTIVLPILLLLAYSFRCFHQILNRLHFHSHILQTFMDSLNGCYKDGTEPGTRDYRWFAAFELLTKSLFASLCAILPNGLFFPTACAMIFFFILLILNIQPYRSRVAHYVKIDLTFYCFIGLLCAMIASADSASLLSHQHMAFLFDAGLAVIFLPLLYMACLSIHWLFSRRRWGRTLVNRLRAWRRGYDLLEESLPDRLLNPSEYPSIAQRKNDSADSSIESMQSGVHLYT